MWQQLAAASAMSLLDNKLKTSERAQAQRYATMMSNSAHQRQMADMRKAGLNPILSGKYGGASTPNVSQANVGVRTPEFLQQISSAKKAQAEIPKINQEVKSIEQSRVIEQELHDERWPRIMATMGVDNLLSTIVAAAKGINVGDILTQKGVNVVTMQQARDVQNFIQEGKSWINTEADGLSEKAVSALPKELKKEASEMGGNVADAVIATLRWLNKGVDKVKDIVK
jgi:predicted Fe-Mo cluster-binding NifX family protein